MLRPHSTADDATPNPNAVAAQNLVRLAVLSGDDNGATGPTGCSTAFCRRRRKICSAHVALLNALDLRLRGAEIVVTGADSDALAHAALKLPFTERIVLRAPTANALPVTHPARDKIAAAPAGAAFVCVGETLFVAGDQSGSNRGAACHNAPRLRFINHNFLCTFIAA